MTSTLNPACPLCGLRYATRPLLELHIREDHRPRRRPPDRLDAGGIRATTPMAGRPSRSVEEITATTATRSRSGQAMTVPRRVLRALRHVNDELTRASEAIIRSARAPRSRPWIKAPAHGDTRPGTAADRADRAA